MSSINFAPVQLDLLTNSSFYAFLHFLRQLIQVSFSNEIPNIPSPTSSIDFFNCLLHFDGFLFEIALTFSVKPFLGHLSSSIPSISTREFPRCRLPHFFVSTPRDPTSILHIYSSMYFCSLPLPFLRILLVIFLSILASPNTPNFNPI